MDVLIDRNKLRSMNEELASLRSENERLKRAERTWRPISAVPTDHQWKILASKYGCFPGIYYDGWIGSDGEEIQHNITHWMPLPEPPKEEK